MSAPGILASLSSHGVRPFVEGGRLRLAVSRGRRVPGELIAQARAHRAELIELLGERSLSKVPPTPAPKPEPPAAPDPEVLQDTFDERAAIIEHDGGIPREWAEGYTRLLNVRRPSSFSVWRWQQILDDAGRFTDAWARQASAFGWTTADVFGVHPSIPEARHDMKGLIAVLRGGRVVAMSEGGAVIESPTGARHTFRRLPADVSPASLWE